VSHPKEKKILLGLAVAFGAMIIAAVFLLGSASNQRKTADWVAHTRDVLDKIHDFAAGLSDAENGRRGYVLTGNDRYLVYFTNGVVKAESTLQELRQLTLDNPRQTAACDQLEGMIHQRLAIYTNSINEYRKSGRDAPAQQDFTEQGQRATERIREVAARMTSEEQTLLKQRQTHQLNNAKGTEGFSLLVSVFGLGLFIAMRRLLRRANQGRDQAEEALQRTNVELEERVRERTTELSQTVERLEQAEEIRGQIMESAVFGFGALDLEGRFTLINSEFGRLMGYETDELLGKPYSLLLSPENDAALRPEFLRVLGQRERLAHREIDVIKKDGSLANVVFSWSPLLSQGEVKGVVSTVLDITERKRAEELAKRFEALVESSDDAITSKTLDGIVTTWNPGAESLFGYSAQEAIGKPMLMIFPAERFTEEVQILAKIASGQTVEPFETHRVRKDGTTIDVSVTSSPIRDSQGKITGASSISRNITERKQAERKLAAQLSRLDLLSRTTQAIAQRQDLQSIFQLVIRSLEDNLPIDFGCVCLYEPEQEEMTIVSVGVKSQPLALELAMTDQAHIGIDQNGLSRCVRGELVYEEDISQMSFPFPERLARGGLRSLVMAPLLVESTVFGILVASRREPRSFSSSDCEFLRQLSEHVALAGHQAQLYKALQSAYDDLRKSQQVVMQQERMRALGQMASGIAHDINNAISPVAIYTESLLENEPNLSQRAREYLQTIDRAIDDVAATVGRMREFYRPRETQLTLQPVQLNSLVEQVVSLTRARWSDMPQQRGIEITLRTELATDLPAINGVEGEIREALTNLIFNAVDALPAGGTLTIRTRVSSDSPGSDGAFVIQRVRVEVIDTGVGMDEETRRRCLEPFFTTKGERGTGLGLPMVYGVAQRHGAELEIESTVGQGTTIRLDFPASAATVTRPSHIGSPPFVPLRLRILAVDDDPVLLKSLQDTLQIDGHAVVTANSGQAGIDAFLAARGTSTPLTW